MKTFLVDSLYYDLIEIFEQLEYHFLKMMLYLKNVFLRYSSYVEYL